MEAESAGPLGTRWLGFLSVGGVCVLCLTLGSGLTHSPPCDLVCDPGVNTDVSLETSVEEASVCHQPFLIAVRRTKPPRVSMGLVCNDRKSDVQRKAEDRRVPWMRRTEQP